MAVPAYLIVCVLLLQCVYVGLTMVKIPKFSSFDAIVGECSTVAVCVCVQYVLRNLDMIWCVRAQLQIARRTSTEQKQNCCRRSHECRPLQIYPSALSVGRIWSSRGGSNYDHLRMSTHTSTRKAMSIASSFFSICCCVHTIPRISVSPILLNQLFTYTLFTHTNSKIRVIAAAATVASHAAHVFAGNISYIFFQPPTDCYRFHVSINRTSPHNRVAISSASLAFSYCNSVQAQATRRPTRSPAASTALLARAHSASPPQSPA